MNQLQQAAMELRLDDLKNMIRNDADLRGTLLPLSRAIDHFPGARDLISLARHDGDRRTRILSASVYWMYALAPRGSDSWLEETMQPRQICFLVAALGAAYVAAGAVSNLIPAESRALVSLCLITMLSMIASAFSKTQPRKMITAMVAATVLSMFVIYGWRRLFDPMAAVGPVPPSLEPVALVVLGVINIVAATIVALVFSAGRRVFRFRWIVFGATGTVLFAFCVMASRWAEEANSPQALLRRVVMLEQSSDRNGWGERQELSTALAILGRQREAREIPLRPDAVGHELSDPPDTPDSDPPFVVTPWREAMTRIAAEQRLVLIMEAHTVTEHRAWIEQTLGFFRAAGFTHYFAETIAESGSTLKSRGYPTSRTGFYTLDPRFGNLVRTAIRLGFEVGGYDLARS